MLKAASEFVTAWMPVIQAQPAMLDMAFEMLAFALRRFKMGRSLEEVIEQTKMKLQQAAAAAQAARPEGAGRAGQGAGGPAEGADRRAGAAAPGGVRGYCRQGPAGEEAKGERMTVFVYRSGRLVEKSKAPPFGGVFVYVRHQAVRHPGRQGNHVAFGLRAYEQANGVKQVGNDMASHTAELRRKVYGEPR
jgi:hypothetical protein